MNTKHRGWELSVKPVHLAVLLLFGASTTHAAGTNLIVNGGFENNPPASCGNNLGWGVEPWVVGDGAPTNVVKVDGDQTCMYGMGGPTLDAESQTVGTLRHYLDIQNGDNTISQRFNVPSCGSKDATPRSISFSGDFSIRDNRWGSGTIEIFDETTQKVLGHIDTPDDANGNMYPKNAAGVVVPSHDQVWRKVSGTLQVVPGHKITYRATVSDFTNFDNAQLSFADFTCPSTQITVVKQWSTGIVGDASTISVKRANNGDLADLSVVDSLASTADATGTNTTTDTTPFTAPAGDKLLIKESFPASQLTTYSQALSCTNPGIIVSGDAQTGFIIDTDPTAPPTESTCTLVNTALPSLIVKKQWQGAQVDDAANITIVDSANATPLQFATRATTVANDAAGEEQHVAQFTIAAGAHTFNLAEAMTGPTAGGTPAFYDTAISCTNAAGIVTGGVFTTTGNPGPSICTFTNTIAGLQFTKAAGSPYDANASTIVGDAGDTVLYGFMITNTGRATVTNVAVNDPLLGTLPAANYEWPDAKHPGVLLPGQTAKATAVYTLTKADADEGSLTNVATASGSTVNSRTAVTSNTGSTTTPTHAAHPALSITKSATLSDANGTGMSGDAGDLIAYSFVVNNTGDTPLFGVTLADPLPGLSGVVIHWPDVTKPGTLTVGQSAMATATYMVTAADVAAGKVNNSATVASNPISGVNPAATSNETSTPTKAPSPALGITKQSSVTDTNNSGLKGDAGDVISYVVTVTNTGDSKLTGVTVTDPLPGLTGVTTTWPDEANAGTLAVGQSTTLKGSYTVTAADAGAGRVVNTATAAADKVAGVTVPSVNASSETTVQTTSPKLALVKTASAADTNSSKISGDAGDMISYQIKVSNAGNVNLSGVTIKDPMTGLSALSVTWPNSAKPGVLAIGESATAIATYTITAADVKAGKVINTATASAPNVVDTPVDTSSGSAELIVAAPPSVTGDVAPVPTLGQWALVLLSAMVAGVGTLVRRRKTI
ncbi:IPTL-CTERM sorting domain-containing protein [Diaphorobacter sp. HDW4A]|uniref:IPTL-CTERM sorting domain-containing protein n=1 Tax=Diaphorobacter sp. HDW4A TaxID=2714924 RepID=UPI00140C927F|nr:IPTL-CTERM sorting domain-containing protein [Diaphorobacter sp. HDW4A]QIL78534.1 IPTL-CTERM sorting domain-containing protein [Diaphorobacter sp. HDW4A]